MTDNSALGDRMKRYEATTRTLLPRRTYTILRVDGRSFHSYLRGCVKPFDVQFMTDMDAVAEALCTEIAGARLAYTQSDEISILATDFGSHNTEPWFGGVVAKQLSIAASLATTVLNERRPGARALFDARVFTLSDPVEVANYFLWRQRDAVRNSISMAAQAHFSHKRLHGISGGGMQELLWSEAGVNWNDYPDGCKRGRATVRHTGERPVEYVDRRSGETVSTTAVRSWWETTPALHFTTESGGWLAELVPALPSLRPAPGPAVAGRPITEEEAAAVRAANLPPGTRITRSLIDEAMRAPGPATTQATEHVYLSTGCLHGRHDYCQSMTGMNGAKRPASCKFCRSVCVCPCHTDQPKEQQ